MQLKQFILNSKNIERNSYIWNMAGSMLMAFQSVIMLMILTRTLGLTEAGIFTIAYANANLFLTIGKYGMRYFQVSDIKEEFNFLEYRSSRYLTVAAMLIISFAYTVYASINNDYSIEKIQVFLWMCVFKAVDAIEDVYLGLYQHKNRLDIGAKIMTFRMIITIIVFGSGLIIFRNLLLTLIISTVITILVCVIFIKLTYTSYKPGGISASKADVWNLLKLCFPLFAGAFLSFYIGNTPKYAIDAILTDELQACYGFIAMPVFVIGLLNNFIFNPMIYRLSVLWTEGKIKDFVIRIIRQIGIVFLITLVCIIGAYLLGIPVLSWLYNTNLVPYKKELIILLLGGGFLGLSGLLNTVITIMRYQKTVVWGYAIVAVMAYFFSNQIVEKYLMMGAAVLYTILMAVLCIIFWGITIWGIIKRKGSTKPRTVNRP